MYPRRIFIYLCPVRLPLNPYTTDAWYKLENFSYIYFIYKVYRSHFAYNMQQLYLLHVGGYIIRILV
jgi:hypothetical protein